MEDESRPHGAQSLQQGSPEQGIGRELEERGVDEADDNAAVRTGNAVSEFVFDHHLTKSEKEKGGAVAHYAMGVTSGAIYGAMAEVMPLATVCEGTGFGTAVWVIADEGLVPALGLSRETSEYPASVHVYSLASHLVYGLTTELVRHAVRKALNGATSH
jgi:putative membrane protein